MRSYRPEHLAATANIASAPAGGNARAVLTPAAAVATLVIRQNGAAGAIIMSLQAAANGQSIETQEFRFEGQLHFTLAGAGALAMALT